MTLNYDEVKLQKLNELKELGINPYAYKFDKTHHAKTINEEYASLKEGEKADTTVAVAGRIMLKRVMGKASFYTVQDGSGKVQIYLHQDTLTKDTYKIFTKKIDLGDVIGVKGSIFKTKKGEVTIDVKEIELLTKSLLPMPEKFHGLKDEELRYRQRYLDFIVNPEVKEVFVKRAKIYKAIRAFLDQQGFIEVRTPILQTEYGGANARPFVTKIHAWNMPMYLRIAYELYLKRLIVGGFEKIYDLSSCFRNEGVDKTHNPEFAMMEIQWAYGDYHDAMKLTEELWDYVAKQVNGTTKITFDGKTIDVKAPWPRLTVNQALKKHANIDVEQLSDKELLKIIKDNNIDIDGMPSRGIMITLLFEELCEEKLINPVFITDFPKESCPLSKLHRENKDLTERTEPYINGMEVGNMYSELIDPQRQEQLLHEQAQAGRGGDDEAHPMDEDYIKALAYGLPPNTGIGVGVDRMVMLLTGQTSIRDIILFPTMKPKGVAAEGMAKDTQVAVALLNRSAKMEKWQELNTVGHLNAAFGARQGRSLLLQDHIETKDQQKIKLNMQHAIIIKQAPDNVALQKLLVLAKEQDLEVAEFTREMLETSDDKKVIASTKEKAHKDVEYLGVLIFGKKSAVDKLTKGYPLFS